MRRVQDLSGQRAIWKKMIERDGWEKIRDRKKGGDLQTAEESMEGMEPKSMEKKWAGVCVCVLRGCR